MKRSTFLLIAFGFASVLGFAQTMMKPAYPSEAAQKARLAGNYLAPLLEWREKKDELLKARGNSTAGSHLPLRGIYLQTYGTFSADVGNYRESLAVFDSDPGAAPAPIKDADAQIKTLRESRPRPAREVILELAARYQAVFLNEAHHVPQHRALTLLLLRDLWQQGFRYFAAETLAEEDKELPQRGYPVISKTGYYVPEPVCGDLIRTALRLGYKVVPYEFDHEEAERSNEKLNFQQKRDKAQARNLYERIYKPDPKAKVIVHAGYAHINEKALSWWSPMAMYFREFTGVDPLTIDQTEMTEHSAPKFENAVYQFATERWKLSQPTIFRAGDGKHFVGGNMTGLVDLQVFSPRSEYRDGRPHWLQLGGARQAQRIAIGELKSGFPYVLQAVLVNEEADAVPLDQIEVVAPAQTATLLLPKGNFVIQVKDRTGAVIRNSTRKVK